MSNNNGSKKSYTGGTLYSKGINNQTKNKESYDKLRRVAAELGTEQEVTNDYMSNTAVETSVKGAAGTVLTYVVLIVLGFFFISVAVVVLSKIFQ